jgi:glycosyltransferase involved in cell wall biosynthesis
VAGRAFQPTLVHAATPLGVGLAGRSAARALGVPLVASYHTSLAAYARHYRLGALVGPGWRFLRWFHSGALRTYCPTRAVATELGTRGFPRLAIWGRGVDTTRFSPAFRSDALRARLGVRRGEVLATYVGRLAAEKDLDVLLDAMRLLGPPARSGIRLALVGEGPHEAACRARAPAGTVFTGRLEGDALAEAYASADLFVFPSRTDTFGNVLVEAMASGLPVLAADVPQAREVLAGAGHLFPAGSASALVGPLLRLARDPAERARSSAAGLEAARGFGWSEIFDELFRDYLAVVGPHGARAGRAIVPVPSLRVAT